jgi:hypothetical protein
VDRACHELLAGTRLAEDEDRGVDAGDLVHERDDALDRVAQADDVVQRAAVVEQAAQVVQLRDVVEHENASVRVAGVVLDLDLDGVLAPVGVLQPDGELLAL